MKKFYTLLPILLVFVLLAGQVLGQGTYSALRAGSWHTTSGPNIWDVSGEPPSVCNNCTITITSGITVQLNAHIELQGQSIISLGDGSNNNATILNIGNSSGNNISGGYNVVLDTLPGNSTIHLLAANSTINATSAGEFDGVFSGPLPNPLYNNVFQKLIGNKPSLFSGNIPIGTSPANYGQVLSGPGTLFSGGTLPIILTEFNATLSNNVVNLSWSTSTELNFSHFVVLRSGDGNTWATLGTVLGKNSANGASYSFSDQLPLHGINYYRLSEVDLDGKATLSEIKQIQTATSLGLKFGPNPANDHVGVTFGNNISSTVTIRLFNQYGQALQEKQLSNVAGTTYTMSLSNYPAGIYTVQVKSQDGSQNSSFRVLLAH